MTTATHAVGGREEPAIQLLDRVRHEYLEMPGLALTMTQACRLWHLEAPVCQQLLAELIDSGFLRRTWRQTFVLA